jgi:hypothetical protein
VLIAGGHDNSAEIYDPIARRFVAFLHMGVGRFGQSATLLPDGKVLIAGGFSSAYKALASAEIFDPSSGQFKPIPDMAQGSAGHIATLIPVPAAPSWIKPTPVPTPTPSPTPSPTLSPTATPAPSPTATPTPSSAATPTSTPTPERVIDLRRHA